MGAVTVVAFGVFLVGAAGAIAPLLRPRAPTLERLRDPLEDERRNVLRSLKALEDDRATGVLQKDDYRTLRAETEARAVSVLRRAAERDGDAPSPGDLPAIREPSPVPPARSSVSRWAVAVLVAAALLAWGLPTLAGSIGSRQVGQPITGNLGQGASATNDHPLAFYEQRVQTHPDDVAARLDLAHRYLDAGMATKSAEQFARVLTLDAGSAEARAHLGLLLFFSARQRSALQQVRRALSADPSYPEALYIEGLILRGLGRDREAVASLSRYLDVAPFGSERSLVQRLLARIRAGGTRGG